MRCAEADPSPPLRDVFEGQYPRIESLEEVISLSLLVVDSAFRNPIIGTESCALAFHISTKSPDRDPEMPLEADDQQRVDEAIAETGAEGSTKLLVHKVTEHQKLGPVTVICTILNRTIGNYPEQLAFLSANESVPGSGIYVVPAIVLKSTGSVGISILLWAFGGLVGMSALLVWLEMGLLVPKFEVPDKDVTKSPGEHDTAMQNVPRNGGEKNYLEYIYSAPTIRTTCVYGVIFIILGNLSGNAVAFGIYVLRAADLNGHDAAVRGIAVASMTCACLPRAIWRQGGILLNNLLALMKVFILLAMIAIGFAASAGASFGHGSVHGQTFTPMTHKATSNFDTHSSFSGAKGGTASYVLYLYW